MKNNKEKMDAIGNVVLNYNYYSGEDLYSEGASEDILLDLVTRYEESEYEHVIQNSRSWSVMYHLSHVRENIVSWLPIDKTSSVLEIGAGCGAITGKLSQMAQKVTCIELSKKRSLINATRHKTCDNIEIVVGNFEDIEKELTETYDYITLIGVLEYAESYINAKSPYDEFLRIVGKHLAPGGKLVVAIENKYGLKYFAGCKEDHTGRYYEGIEGYTQSGGVKTFSQEGLLKTLQRAGLQSKFYYPYPDYKLPHTIYSDEYLPKAGELTTNIRNFDADRVVTFDEAKVFDSLIEEGLFPHYSNSFLIIASYDDIRKNVSEMAVYAKYANERSAQFRTATLITEKQNGSRAVYKRALCARANDHIRMIYDNYKALCKMYEKTKLKPNSCSFIPQEEEQLPVEGVFSKGNDQVELAYLKGMTLEKYLDILESQSDYEGMQHVILEYQELVGSTLTDKAETFTMSDEFKSIFGEPKLTKEYEALTGCNFDMIFSNIVFDETTGPNGAWNVLDYEWVFHFLIPTKFIIYRALFYYFQNRMGSGMLSYLVNKGTDIYRECGIDDEECALFAKMEHSFQVSIIEGVASLEVMHAMMPTATVKLERAIAQDCYLRNLNTPKVYFSRGEGFVTENQLYLMADVTEEHLVTLNIPLDGNTSSLRIDPTEYPCLIHVEKLELVMADGEKTELSRFLMNGYAISEKTILYDTFDAQIILEQLDETAQTLHVEYLVTMIDETFYREIKEMLIKKIESEKESLTLLDRILLKCKMKAPDETPEGFAYNMESEAKE